MTANSDQRLAFSSERYISIQLDALRREPVAVGAGHVKFVPVLMSEPCLFCGGQLYLHSEGVVIVCADCLQDFRYLNGKVVLS